VSWLEVVPLHQGHEARRNWQSPRGSQLPVCP
jgi:hypothetical protein